MDSLPIEDAIDFISSKIISEDWNAEQWLRQEPDVRARAFFSSNVESARFLNRAHSFLDDFMRESTEEIVTDSGEVTTALKMGSRADFVRGMREFMMKEGMLDDDELDRIKKTSDADIAELGSRARLKLIFDTNVRSAWGYGHWKQGMKPAVLNRYPAAKFIRIPGAREPRARHIQHEDAIKLKWDDKFWADLQNGRDIGGFEVPWAPYGFNSYMDQEDVSRKQAEAEGLLKKGEAVPTAEGDKRSLNDNLKAGTKTLDPKIKRKLLENLRREGELNKGRKSASELAKEAAQRSRLAAIKRTLEKARERGDTAEVDRIREVLRREQGENSKSAEALKVHDSGDEVSLAPSDYVEPELSSIEDLKKQLRESEEAYNLKFGPTIAAVSAGKLKLERLRKGEPKRTSSTNKSQEAYNKWAQEYNQWVDDYNSTVADIRKNKLILSSAGLDLIELPSGSQGNVQIIGRRPKRGQKAEGVRLFEKVVHKDLTEQTVIEFAGGASRSKHKDMGTHGKIWMDSSKPPSIVAHEIMHQTEIRFLLAESREFLKKRAKAEQPKSLRALTGKTGYKKGEKAYEDDFERRGSEHYAGKLYGQEAEQAFATELLTMGLERLLSNPIDFMLRDEEYFTWVIKLIQKRK